jgi:hypothetical protein
MDLEEEKEKNCMIQTNKQNTKRKHRNWKDKQNSNLIKIDKQNELDFRWNQEKHFEWTKKKAIEKGSISIYF